MTPPTTPDTPPDPDRHAEEYFRSDVEEFHREANVLAGHDPAEVTSDQPTNLSARRWLVFVIIVITGLIAAGIAVGLMAVPQCENPQYNWLPCIPELSR